MTGRLMGFTMAGILAASSAIAGTVEPEIKVVRDGRAVTVTLAAGTLTLAQTLTRTAVDVLVADGDDVVQVAGDLDGRVVVSRGQQRHAFSMRTAKPADQAVLRAMLEDSPALAAFDRLLQTTPPRSIESALFTSTRELIRVFEADEPTIAPQAANLPVPAATMLVRVGQRSPSQCWDTYARDVIHFTYELQSCLNSASYSWNPFATGWCAYEYNLKSSLAAVWLLDCYGVPA